MFRLPTRWFSKLLTSEDGATAVEYAVMLALIIGVAILAIGAGGDQVFELWSYSSDEVTGALDGN